MDDHIYITQSKRDFHRYMWWWWRARGDRPKHNRNTNSIEKKKKSQIQFEFLMFENIFYFQKSHKWSVFCLTYNVHIRIQNRTDSKALFWLILNYHIKFFRLLENWNHTHFILGQIFKLKKNIPDFIFLNYY